MDLIAVLTRKLLVDAVNDLLPTKDTDHISIEVITELETVNLATFYAHFVDEYELLDVVLTTIRSTMQKYFSCHEQLIKQTIGQLFLLIVQLHNNMHAICRRGYNPFTRMIERKQRCFLFMSSCI